MLMEDAFTDRLRVHSNHHLRLQKGPEQYAKTLSSDVVLASPQAPADPEPT